MEIWNKYTGQDNEHGKLLDWMRKLGYISDQSKVRTINPIKPASLIMSQKPSDDPIELQRRIKELEKQLESAQLKAEGYELMIEIAEKELNIPIRKKSGTKFLKSLPSFRAFPNSEAQREEKRWLKSQFKIFQEEGPSSCLHYGIYFKITF